jgi:chemotaxis protein CheD
VRQIVGVADMKISNQNGDEIITYALGSCIGITIFDPVACVGGMVHVMLPSSSIDLAKAAENPCMFVDTGVPKLFLDCYKAGASKSRLEVIAAGGACTSGAEDDDYFQIGKRNITILRKLLWKNGVLLKASDLAGTIARTMTLHLGSGLVTVRTGGAVKSLNGNDNGGSPA